MNGSELMQTDLPRFWPGQIPTGMILPVEGTPMDLRSLKRVGDEVDADFEQMTLVQGYDHNWVLKNHGKLEQIAR